MLEKYNLFVLLNGTNTEEQNNETIKIVENLINKFDGKIINSDEPFKRRLAYVIKKVRNGVYTNLYFEIDTEKVNKLNQELLLTPEILRFQILKYVPIKKSPKKPKSIALEIDVKKETKETTEKKPSNEDNKKIDMEDLNKKLDEILDSETIN